MLRCHAIVLDTTTQAQLTRTPATYNRKHALKERNTYTNDKKGEKEGKKTGKAAGGGREEKSKTKNSANVKGRPNRARK